MTTDRDISFSVSTSDIITEALEIIGVLPEGQTFTTDQYTSALRTLNMMTKTWQADGLNLFAVQLCALFLIPNQIEYLLSNLTSDNFTHDFVTTGLNVSGNYSTGATTITLTNPYPRGVGGHIGIALSGTTMLWTTVTSIAGNNVGIATPLPSNVTSGALVYCYANKAFRPMRILEAYLQKPGDISIPIGMLSRVDYFSLSRKSTASSSLQLYFDPEIDPSATMKVWPTSQSGLDYILLLVQRTLGDFVNSTDTPDYPQEWYGPLAWNLAVELSPKYGIPAMDFQRIAMIAKEKYEMAKGWDVEQETSLYFKPDNWGSNIGRRGG